MKKKVTIQDIADELGVSRNTVSKAINNSEGLAEATRERVLQKAVEMGYKQFSYVSSLTRTTSLIKESASESTGFVGEIALFTTVFLSQSHFASLMLDKFQREITQLGYTLNTHRITAEDIQAGTLPVTFVPERCSGIICIEMFDRAYDGMLCELGIPILFVDGPVRYDGSSLPADQLYMDNTTAVIRFIREMLRRGFRKIGWIGSYDHCQSFFERYAAYRITLFMANVPVEEKYVVNTNDSAEMKAALCAAGELPDVFLCANDFIACDCLRVLSELGKKVPADVRLCGFDDSPESRIVFPELTTIHIHTQVMAYSAAHLLISRIREPSLDLRTIYTETELVFREST